MSLEVMGLLVFTSDFKFSKSVDQRRTIPFYDAVR